MEELIELYLFKNKKCALPSIGVLHVLNTSAVSSYSEGKISAPVPTVKLVEQDASANGLVEFIASRKNVTTDQASDMLTRYCNSLQNMDAYGETKLPNTGKFYMNADGNLVFKTMEMPKAFLPEVIAERVIHPDVAHSMVVGDKETTTTEMAAYYAESGAPAKDRWWIWAAALALIAVLALAFYFSNGSTDTFGNTQQVEPTPASATYLMAE